MRALQLPATLVLALACVSAYAADTPVSVPNGLERVENSRAKLSYVRPGTNWSKYKTVMLQTLAVPIEVRNVAPGRVISDADVAAVQKIYLDDTRSALLAGGYVLVEKVRPTTLIISAQIVGITPNDPSKTNSADASKGTGSISMVATFIDGETGQTIAQVNDQKYSSNIWGVNSKNQNVQEAKRIFYAWAAQIRNNLQGQKP